MKMRRTGSKKIRQRSAQAALGKHLSHAKIIGLGNPWVNLMATKEVILTLAYISKKFPKAAKSIRKIIFLPASWRFWHPKDWMVHATTVFTSMRNSGSSMMFFYIDATDSPSKMWKHIALHEFGHHLDFMSDGDLSTTFREHFPTVSFEEGDVQEQFSEMFALAFGDLIVLDPSPMLNSVLERVEEFERSIE